MLENCVITIEDETLTIKVNLAGEPRPSKNRCADRRTLVVGTTNGTLRLCDSNGNYRPECLNLSVWRKPAPGELERLEREARFKA